MTTEPEIYEGTPETLEQEAMRKWWYEQRLKSADNIETAARQIITLTTSLLTILFGILALTESPLPAYLDNDPVRVLGIFCILFLFAALAAALVAVLPRRYTAPMDLPHKQEESFQKLLTFKSTWLTTSIILFALALLLLALLAILALALV